MNTQANICKEIIEEMKVKPVIDVEREIRIRTDFIKKKLVNAGLTSLVLGISGGVDSGVLGKLAQNAVNELNEEEGSDRYRFFAMRLPYGTQADEEEAMKSIDFIQPSKVLAVDIAESVIAMSDTVVSELGNADIQVSDEQADFAKGNVKARARMIAQYQVAGLVGGLVLGTDHSAENVAGFYTKFGDGACDLAPLFGLNKRQVRMVGKALGAPEWLYAKVATADLECLDPGKTDESVLGVSYDAIDDFLEGKAVSQKDATQIVGNYLSTLHKREEIPTIYNY